MAETNTNTDLNGIHLEPVRQTIQYHHGKRSSDDESETRLQFADLVYPIENEPTPFLWDAKYFAQASGAPLSSARIFSWNLSLC
jgi:hypothetical protein